MKNYNQIILTILCVFTVFLSCSNNVLAQPAIPNLSKPSSIVFSSQPEIYVKNIVLDNKVYKAGDTVKGSFVIFNNKTQAVSDVYYKISLAGDYQKNNLAKVFYDSVKMGPISFKERESKEIDFTYVLPKAVAGDNLGIQISALLGSGLQMGWSDSMIKVEGETALLKISKAVISIGDNKFDFQTGTSVSGTDQAFLEVNLTNPTKNIIEIIPKIKIYNNATPETISNELNLDSVTVSAYGSSSIKYELPKFENKAGIYIGTLSFFDTAGVKRVLDLQFNYVIPEIKAFDNKNSNQDKIPTGKAHTIADYILFTCLILLGIGLIGIFMFLFLKFKKKVPLSLFIILFILGLMSIGVEKAQADTLVKCGNDYYYSSVGNIIHKKLGSTTGTDYSLGQTGDMSRVITCVNSDAYWIYNFHYYKSPSGFTTSYDLGNYGNGDIIACGPDAYWSYNFHYYKSPGGFATSYDLGNDGAYNLSICGSDVYWTYNFHVYKSPGGFATSYDLGFGNVSGINGINCVSSDAYWTYNFHVYKSPGGFATSYDLGSGSTDSNNFRSCSNNAGEFYYNFHFYKSNFNSPTVNTTGTTQTCSNSPVMISPCVVPPPITYTLTINKAGTGSGTVTGAGTYNSGIVVTATATPAVGSTFSGWSGDCNSSGQVTMNSAKTCTATFILATYVLAVNKAGTGSGTVTGAGTYNSGIIVTATETPSAGSTFSGWSGDCNASGQVTMNSAKTCIATFTLSNIATPNNVILSIPSCGGSTVHLSWSGVTGAAQYKIYKNNISLSTTTATSSDITVISSSTDILSVSAISATGVESATSTSVSVPAGITPTNLSVSGVGLYDAPIGGNLLNITNTPPNQVFYLRGYATAENDPSQYLHMDYYYNTGGSSWILGSSNNFTTINSFDGSNAVRGGSFSIGPFYISSTPGDHLFSYYVDAYPSCAVNYTGNIRIMDPANSIEYSIPYPASCGSLNGGASFSAPGGTDACSHGNISDPSDGSNGIWSWKCITTNGDTDSCSATKSQSVLNPELNCSLLTATFNKLNANSVLTASTTIPCPLCVKSWTLIDNNNPSPGKPITVIDNTSYILNNIFTTVGLKTINVQVTSADGSSHGNVCTSTTNITQGEENSGEI